MSHLDEPDDDYRAADGRADQQGRDRGGRTGRRRATQPARPAWDAATYGRPDDTRRPVRRNASPPAPPPDDHAPPPPYSPDSYSPDSYSPDSYSSDTYSSERYSSTPYPSEPVNDNSYFAADSHSSPSPTYNPDAYATDPYRPDPYPSDPYPSDPYPSDPYPSAPAADGDYPAAAYPSASGTYAPDRYTSFQVDPDPAYGGEEPPAPTYVAAGLYLDDGSDPAHADQAYPGGQDEGSVPAAPAAAPGGRNLPAAVGVGVGLAVVVLASLFLWRPAFLAVVAIAVGVGIWELVRAVRTTGVNPPLLPLVAGGALMTGLAWWGAADALTFGLMVTVLAAMVWRLADGALGYGQDVAAATLVAVYVPFLGGFAAMLASPADGDLRVLVTLAAVVLSDTGGYIVGAKLGRRAMAPSVSPKKSWEGLAGSLGATAIGSAILLMILFDASIWWGLLFGVAVSAASVVGDLGESMIKRDLGVKDMSSLLPGHGGLMDRLDSIVLAAPTAYLMLALIAPV